MADTLESLEIEVKHSASGADAEINKVAEAVTKLSNSLTGVPAKLRKLVEVMNAVKGNMSLTINDNGMTQTADTINNVQQTAAKAGKAAQDAGKGIKEMSKEASKAQKPLGNFVSSLKRIAFYRIIRGIIKSISQAMQEGLEKAYLFSQGVSGEGNRFAQSLDHMKSAGNAMKGQLGSAFISLLAAVEPVLIALINIVTKAADAIAQLLAAFTGKTYLKANVTAAKFADTMARGGAAAKEWRNQLLGFDEINRLNAPSDGGGGSGSNPLDGYKFEDAPINEKILNFVNTIKEQVSAAGNRTIATNSIPFSIIDKNGYRSARFEEHPLGNLCADAFRHILDTDIAMVNGGGIRAGLPTGEITYNHLLALFPFSNMACTATLNGQQLADVLECSVRLLPEENGSFMQVSGIRFNVDTTLPSPVVMDEKGLFSHVADVPRRVSHIYIRNKENGEYEAIDSEKKYTLASFDFQLKKLGSDGIFRHATLKDDNLMLDVHILSTYIKEVLGGHIGAPYGTVEGRINIQR
jgi:hypothetical protein